MDILKPRWSSSSFLVYAGVLTIGLAASYSLQYLQSQYGHVAYAAWALLVLAVLLALARLARSALAAGVFAFVSIMAFAAFLAALWHWFGWSTGGNGLDGFHLARQIIVLLTLLFAVSLARRFRHPLLALPVAGLVWLFVTDFVSNGGNWSAIVSVIVGLVLLVVGATLDRGARRPYGFWVHVVAGLAMGGALLFWWHHGNWRFALLAVGGLVFVRVASATGRSSYAVLGAVGLLIAAAHYAIEWWHRSLPFFGENAGTPRAWVPPVVFAVLGFVYLTLGAIVSRRERR